MFAPVKIIASLALSAALLAGASTAMAAPFQSNGRTTEVRFHDLNLANKADQAILKRRLARAATSVCTDKDLGTSAACRRIALDHIKAPVAAAIARAESGERYADAGNVSISVGK